MLKGDSLYDIENVTVVHHVNQALKAHKLFHRDRDYIVKDGEVIIIDEFTGRMMRAGATRKACTRRSKPRNTSRSSPKTRRSPRSPSRTTSASTTSSPA